MTFFRIVYNDTFATNTSANYATGTDNGGTVGTWTFNTGNVTNSDGAEGTLIYTGQNNSFADGYIEVVFQETGSGCGIGGRRKNKDNVYATYFNLNSLVFDKIVGGVYTQLDNPLISFPANTSHTARLVIIGNDLKVYFDNTLISHVIDSDIVGVGQWQLIGEGRGTVGTFSRVTIAQALPTVSSKRHTFGRSS